MNEPDDNPYRAPQSTEVQAETAMPPGKERSWKGWLISWTLLYMANLIVPLLFGFGVVDGVFGAVGMFAGILMFYAATLVIARKWKSVWLSGCIGAAFVALSQFFPMLQLYAGLGGLLVSEFVFKASPTPVSGNLHGPAACLTTIVTGSLLLAVAMIVGLVGAQIYNSIRKAKR